MILKKIDSAKRIIADAYEVFDATPDTTAIMFSGGKDSIVMASLVKETIGVTKAFCEASLLPDGTLFEIQKAAETIGIDPTYHHQHTPEKFAELHWLNQMPPAKWRPSTLDKVRHWVSMPKFAKANKLRLQIYGRRKEENTILRPVYLTAKHGRTAQCHPIHDWTKQEVWEYINSKNLNYPSCYKTGSPHLHTWITLAHKAYAERGSIEDAFDAVRRHAPTYLNCAAKYDPRVEQYLAKL
jgi:3'-phosphoadenosine 5'-phosphosulfate sulfotransferase (PAPS reductase)/FAD synthetase